MELTLTTDLLKEILMRYFSIGDSDVYSLTRVKEAFWLGTMHLEDFVEWDETNIDDLLGYIVKNANSAT